MVRYLVTGHTGFKGSWLAMWLNERGHSVHGLALAPEHGSLHDAASVAKVMASSEDESSQARRQSNSGQSRPNTQVSRFVSLLCSVPRNAQS